MFSRIVLVRAGNIRCPKNLRICTQSQETNILHWLSNQLECEEKNEWNQRPNILCPIYTWLFIQYFLREKYFMSHINSLSQADIGLSQKVMRNAKTFYHNSGIGALGLLIYLSKFVFQSIFDITRKSAPLRETFSTFCGGQLTFVALVGPFESYQKYWTQKNIDQFCIIYY